MAEARVLLIEDDEDSRLLLRRVLERPGMTVVEAATGTQGLRELYGPHPDVVLLDIGLPEIDGWRTLERIRALTEVPVMMWVGKASSSTMTLTVSASDSRISTSEIVMVFGTPSMRWRPLISIVIGSSSG